MEDRKILVTGATGLLGGFATEVLTKRGADEPIPAYPFMGPVDISRAMEELKYQRTPFSECVNEYVELTKTRGAS